MAPHPQDSRGPTPGLRSPVTPGGQPADLPRRDLCKTGGHRGVASETIRMFLPGCPVATTFAEVAPTPSPAALPLPKRSQPIVRRRSARGRPCGGRPRARPPGRPDRGGATGAFRRAARKRRGHHFRHRTSEPWGRTRRAPPPPKTASGPCLPVTLAWRQWRRRGQSAGATSVSGGGMGKPPARGRPEEPLSPGSSRLWRHGTGTTGLRSRTVRPNRLSTSSVITKALRPRSSRKGLSSTTSTEPTIPDSASISMTRCASR